MRGNLISVEREMNPQSKEKIGNSLLEDFMELKKNLPPEVIARANKDDKFLYYLISCKDNPTLLLHVINSPENKKYITEDGLSKEYTKVELLSKFTGSMINWAKQGFKQVSHETYAKRIQNCFSCNYLKPAPDNLVYKVKLARESRLEICAKCGCVASRKARLVSESCPEAHWQQE